VEEAKGPVAVRYPRGGEGAYIASDWQGMDGNLVARHRFGTDVTFVTYGSMLANVLEAAEELSKSGIEATVLRLLSVSDLRVNEILDKMSSRRSVIIVEEVAANSGIREALAWQLHEKCSDVRCDGIDLGTDFVPHGSVKELYADCGLDAKSIAEFAKEVLSK